MPRRPTALAEAMKDPLFAALAMKLPPPGSVWPRAKRNEWLELLSKSFSQIYDDAAPAEAGGALTGAAGQSPQSQQPAKYYILPDGTAMASSDEYPKGRMIDPHQIPVSTVVMDYRPQPIDDELNPIMWVTQGAKAMRLPAGVKLRAATGLLPVAVNGAGENSEAMA